MDKAKHNDVEHDMKHDNESGWYRCGPDRDKNTCLPECANYRSVVDTDGSKKIFCDNIAWNKNSQEYERLKAIYERQQREEKERRKREREEQLEREEREKEAKRRKEKMLDIDEMDYAKTVEELHKHRAMLAKVINKYNEATGEKATVDEYIYLVKRYLKLQDRKHMLEELYDRLERADKLVDKITSTLAKAYKQLEKEGIDPRISTISFRDFIDEIR